MNQATEPKSYEFFLATWQVYRKIVDADYMYHRQIFGDIKRLLEQSAKPQSKILDLGCGDGGTIRPILDQIPFSSYLGIDASLPALELARRELEAFGDRIELQCSDMLDFLRKTPSEAFNVILASFSLHHFDAQQKQGFLRLCKNRLEPQGLLIIVDVFRDTGQDRASYLTAFCRDMTQRWTTLTQEELLAAMDHVRTHDFPESLEGFIDLAKGEGLTCRGPVTQYGYYAVTAFSA